MSQPELSSPLTDPGSGAKLRAGLMVTALSYFFLIALFTITNLLRPSGPNWTILIAESLPLLLLLPGLWQKYHRSYSWLCFLMLIYFIKAVDGAFAPQSDWGDYMFVILSVSTFISAMLTARWLQRAK